MSTNLRAPSIKRMRHTVQETNGRVAPVGTIELDTIEPREHSAWMQNVSAEVNDLRALVAELLVRVKALESKP